MTSEQATVDRSDNTLREILRVARRRVWIIVGATILVTAAAAFFSYRQVPLYEASSRALLTRDNIASRVSGIEESASIQQADRFAETQARVARLAEVAAATLRRAGLDDRTPARFLRQSSVGADARADVLNFSVIDVDPDTAVKLATAYALSYQRARVQFESRGIQRARASLSDRLVELEEEGGRRSELYRELVGKEQELATLEALLTSSASIVSPAETAQQIQPRYTRNFVLGGMLGLMFGTLLALLWNAVDTRVRSAEEVAETLGLPLLARLPEPPKRLRSDRRLIMLGEPNGAGAEAFRMLRRNLEFVNLERGARTIMVTSSVQGEGKSTTIANLAVALARAGQRVVLVDLDLRRPIIDRFFRLEGRAGVTDVALGQARLDEALVSVAVAKADPTPHVPENGHGGAHILKVLPAGTPPPNPGEFVESRALADILTQLRAQADLVLVDAPPLLQVGDAMGLSARVDALFLVARLKIVRRPMLRELRRVLETCPASKLGFCLAGAQLEEDVYQAGYYNYRKEEPKARRKPRRRRRALRS